MPTKSKTKSIFDRPADAVSSSDYQGDSMIDPMSIYGFPNLKKGEAPVVTDHPDFPNPRTGPMDRDLIEEIKAQGAFVEPVQIYFHEVEGEEVAVLVNGKTRLTAVAEAWAENPETDAFRMVPYTVVTGTPLEVQFLQAKLNLEDTRRPLSEIETADFLVRMEQAHGLTEAQQLEYLKKPVNQGTTRWLREVKQVASDPVAREAVEKGDIDMTTAKNVAKVKGEKAKKEAVETVKKAKAGGKTERQARQEVKAPKATSKGEKTEAIRTGNRTTLGFKPTLELLKEYYPYAKQAHQRNVNSENVDWTNKVQREDYLFDQEVIARLDMIVKFMKLDHLSLREQFVEIEALLGKDECEALKVISWLPEETSTAKSKKTAEAKPKAKKEDGKAKAKPAPKKAESAKPAKKKPTSSL